MRLGAVLVDLREPGAGREAVIVSSAPFGSSLFSVAVMREPLTPAWVSGSGRPHPATT